VRARHPEASACAAARPDAAAARARRRRGQSGGHRHGQSAPGGPLNWLAQQIKKTVARALDWHVREQVEFNRNVMACVQAALEALEETRRALAMLDRTGSELRGEAQELKDIRSHWVDWRQEWEHKLVLNETKLLRSVAELNAAFQHRAGQLESSFRDRVKEQHDEFDMALERSSMDIQKRLWADMERVRSEYDRLIHTELRLIRQRTPVPSSAPASAPPSVSRRPRRRLWNSRSITPVSPSASVVLKSTCGPGSDSICRFSTAGAMSWISAVGAASFWN
jgi:hypothetical protein